jgi:acyl-coenzyme A synthetase/AMP-(fatty) acid ligase
MIHVYQAAGGIVRDVGRLGAAVLIVGAEDYTDEMRAGLQAQGVAGIVLSGMSAAAMPGCERATATATTPPEPQVAFFTSGTTGPPKQVGMSYTMLAEHATAASMLHLSEITDSAAMPPVFLYLPFGNFSGISAALPMVAQGLRGVMADRFTMESFHDFVSRHRPKRIAVPAATLQMMLDAKLPKEDFASLEAMNSGASSVDPTVQRAFEDHYGLPVLLSYGATEFGGRVTTMTLDLYKEWGQKKFGSVGRPIAGVKIRAVDPKTGAVLPPGQEGLLEIISPKVGPEWIHTTDIGIVDADGFLFHRGRADGAIMRGGFKVLPETIEQALKLHKAISAVGVTAVADRRLGEVPAAAIQLEPDAERPTIAELESHLRHHVEATHIPMHWRFVDSLPYTVTLKVDRTALRRLFEGDGAPQRTS